MKSIKESSEHSGSSAAGSFAGKVRFAAPLFIGLLALSIRWSHIILLAESDPAFAHSFMDARWHVEWARALVMGVWNHEPFFRAPLYPFFLGALFKVFGMGLLAPRLAQGVLGALTCVLIWALGKKLAGPKVGKLAGIIAALYGPMVYFDAEFLIPVLFLPLTVGSLLLLIGAMKSSTEEKPVWGRLTAAGFIAGLAAIARPNMLIMVPGIFVWIIWEIPGWRRRLTAFAVWLALFMAPVGFVTAYNAVEGGGFVPVAGQGGVNFWIGNNPGADGKTAMSPAYYGPVSEVYSLYRDSVQVNSHLEAEKRLGRKLRSDQVSSYWFGQGLRFIFNEPGAWIRLSFRKVYFLINGYELPSNREIYPVRRWSPILGVLLWERPLAFPFGLIFPLALVGMLLAWKNPEVDISAHRLILIYVFIYSAGVVAFFVTSRHRLPLLPALIPYAAFASASIPAGLKKMRARSMSRPGMAVVGMMVFALALIMSNMDYLDVRQVPRREHHMNMGYAFTSEKRYEEALDEYRAALEEEPRLDRARFNIGAVYLFMGRLDEARSAFMETLEKNPRYTEAWAHLGNVYFEEGNFADAEAAYRKALSLDPRHTLARYNLAILYKKKGDFDDYVRELMQANRSDPNFAPVNIEIAAMLMQQGRYEEAREFIERAVRIDPNDPRLKQLIKMMPR